jgi:hypothetical protein
MEVRFMAKQVQNQRKPKPDAQQRQLRTSQIIFGLLSFIIILSMVLSLFIS